MSHSTASSSSSSSTTASFPLGPHTLPTPRLTIRTPTSSDIPALLDFFTNPAAASSEPPQTNLTEEILAQRIEKWDKTRAEGVNAWLIVCLPTRAAPDRCGEKVIGFGGYNSFPRTRLLNSAERASDGVPEGEKVLCGDIGMGIDVRYQRKGYAREAICAMVEYAFGTLRCGYIHLDTQHDNTAFRAVMSDMGIPEKPGSGEEHEDALFGFAWKSLNYDFDESMWSGIREGLKQRGKWPL